MFVPFTARVLLVVAAGLSELGRLVRLPIPVRP